MSTNPQVGTFIFLEGQGAPQKQCYASMEMQNPGGDPEATPKRREGDKGG